MPVLQYLELDFAPKISISAWSAIANGPPLLMLTELNLYDCHMDMRDYCKIVSGMGNMRTLIFRDLHLYNGFRADLAQSYLDLANGCCELQLFDQSSLFVGKDEELVFPSSVRKPCFATLRSNGEIEDEDDWVMVHILPKIYWKGKDDIRWVMREMASYLQSL